ncbi:MAG: CHASE3 domain-containing protein, partial [Candidatus Acidiferrales bacterium]
MKPSLMIRHEAERLALLVAFLLVLLTAVFTYRAWATFEYDRQQALITRQVVDGTTSLLSSLKDAEAGQRGFLLTGDDRYLEPYRQALTQVPASLDSLARIETDRHRPEQLRRVERLKPLAKDKMDELAQTVELRRSQGIGPALAVLRTDRGKAAMDRIRAICAEIQEDSYDLLGRQREEVRTSAFRAGLIGTLGSAAVFALLAAATIIIRKGTRHRQRLIEGLQRSEEEARAARDLLQTTISSIGEGLITADPAGKVVLLNPVARSLTGWTQEQAVGEPLEEVFNIGDEETGAAASNPARQVWLVGNTANLPVQSTLTAKDGRHIPVEESAAP